MDENTKTYPGGKNGSGTYQQIINLMPYHMLYMEGFLGKGSIYDLKTPADNSILIDIDSRVNNFFPGQTIHNFDTIQFLQTAYPLINLIHNLGISVLIYLDPPYPFFTRRSCNRKLYKFEMTDLQHKKMLVAAAKLNCYVMISSYKNAMYDNYLEGWNTHQFSSQTRHGKRIECVYFNYPKPTHLHDYRYLGDDFRDRERIRGIKQRTINKFSKMSAVERNSILKELIPMIPGSIINNNDTSALISTLNSK